MVFVGELFKKLRLGVPLSSEDCEALLLSDCSKEQRCASLAALLNRKTLTQEERQAVDALAKAHPEIAFLMRRGDFLAKNETNPLSEFPGESWRCAFGALLNEEPIGESILVQLLADVVEGDSFRGPMAAFLMLICNRGLSSDDLAALTLAMAHSGEEFDYRGDPALRGARLVRRYPTGALSEKVALILPALIACARSEVNVVSPFLVARSLGYTGGTWDKLKSVSGFRFPEPGDDTVRTLSDCGVAMTVTKGNANPADRVLYQLRSESGTIESIPLIVSSIASKHICFPVDRLLLDVRFGQGAFMENREDAISLGVAISGLLVNKAIPTFYELTESGEPTGSAIGNALEVIEALAVMNSSMGKKWDFRALILQRDIVVRMFSCLMEREFPSSTENFWTSFALQRLSNGDVFKSFLSVLISHDVSEETIENLVRNPWRELQVSEKPFSVLSRKSGVLVYLDQRKLGEIVNRFLGAGGNDVAGKFDPTAGLILQVRLGDLVNEGAPLCKVFWGGILDEELIALIQECFEIRDQVLN